MLVSESGGMRQGSGDGARREIYSEKELLGSV